MKDIIQFGLAVIFLSVPARAFAGESDEAEFFNLERASLEESLNIKTSVASMSRMKLRETPGLVTVISREEIQASGARDLIDVLRMVPEFEFGVDVQGNLGIGVRGNWANEGKALLMWDGQVYNEPLYSTLQFARFPVDQIEQIEIIKGPGSVIYGGYAELAVIDIKTRSPAGLNGSEAYAAYGQGRARERDYTGYSFGKVLDGGTEVSAKAFWGEGQRSDRRYSDLSGGSYGMNGNSDLHAKTLNISAEKDGASARLILDGYYMRDRDQFTEILSTGPSKVAFPSVFAEAKYSWQPDESLRVEPKFNFNRTRAWLEEDDYFRYDKTTERVTAALTAFYHPGQYADLLAGSEYFHDAVNVGAATAPESQYPGGKDGVQYDNYAFFGQGSFPLGFANLTAGARYDKHSQYGASIVPRLAATRLAGDFNFKAIYSQAFHAPSIENMRLNPGIKPEKADSGEFEAGYKASETVFISANLFDTVIKDPIIYTYIGSSETYKNYHRTGTAGFGLGFKFKNGASSAALAYQYYLADINRANVYGVPGHAGYMLGFPRHKITLSSSLPAGAGFSVNPSAIYVSRRYGYIDAAAPKTFGELVIANLNLQLKDRPLKRLTLDLGVRDIFNSGYSYIQPYDGGHAPLPAQSREIFFKAGYEF